MPEGGLDPEVHQPLVRDDAVAGPERRLDLAVDRRSVIRQHLRGQLERAGLGRNRNAEILVPERHRHIAGHGSHDVDCHRAGRHRRAGARGRHRISYPTHALLVNDVDDPVGVAAVAHQRQQALVGLVGRVVVRAQDESAEAAVVKRGHDLRHLDAVGLDRELLIALEHLADGVAVDDEHRTKERLKELPLLPNLLEHRIRLELQEQPDNGANRPPLTQCLAGERLELLRFRLRERRRPRLAGQLLQPRHGHGVVGDDSVDGGEEGLQCHGSVRAKEAEVRRGRIGRKARRPSVGARGIDVERESHVRTLLP